MAASGLIDTGAILALLDRKDHWHQRSADAFVRLRTPLATSVAVLTEVFHLIGTTRVRSQALGDFCTRGP